MNELPMPSGLNAMINAERALIVSKETSNGEGGGNNKILQLVESIKSDTSLLTSYQKALLDKLGIDTETIINKMQSESSSNSKHQEETRKYWTYRKKLDEEESKARAGYTEFLNKIYGEDSKISAQLLKNYDVANKANVLLESMHSDYVRSLSEAMKGDSKDAEKARRAYVKGEAKARDKSALGDLFVGLAEKTGFKGGGGMLPWMLQRFAGQSVKGRAENLNQRKQHLGTKEASISLGAERDTYDRLYNMADATRRAKFTARNDILEGRLRGKKSSEENKSTKEYSRPEENSLKLLQTILPRLPGPNSKKTSPGTRGPSPYIEGPKKPLLLTPDAGKITTGLGVLGKNPSMPNPAGESRYGATDASISALASLPAKYAVPALAIIGVLRGMKSSPGAANVPAKGLGLNGLQKALLALTAFGATVMIARGKLGSLIGGIGSALGKALPKLISSISKMGGIVGKLAGPLSKVGTSLTKKLPFIGAAVQTIQTGKKVWDIQKNKTMSKQAKTVATSKEVGSGIGSFGGSLAGAAAGAAIGSVIPVIGTAIGGLLGAVVGGLGGDFAGGALGKAVGKKLAKPEFKAPEVHHKGGVVGSGSSQEVNTLLEKGEVVLPNSIVPLYQQIAASTQTSANLIKKDVLDVLRSVEELLQSIDGKTSRAGFPAATSIGKIG